MLETKHFAAQKQQQEKESRGMESEELMTDALKKLIAEGKDND